MTTLCASLKNEQSSQDSVNKGYAAEYLRLLVSILKSKVWKTLRKQPFVFDHETWKNSNLTCCKEET